MLVPAFPRIAVTATASARALAPGALAEIVRERAKALGRASSDIVGVFPTVEDALAEFTACGADVVAAGTITLAGEVAGLLRG